MRSAASARVTLTSASFVWLFIRERASALAKRDRLIEAASAYEFAASECERYRATVQLRTPHDFLKDVLTMRKKAESLRRKLRR
jgi:hypothetical protein